MHGNRDITQQTLMRLASQVGQYWETNNKQDLQAIWGYIDALVSNGHRGVVLFYDPVLFQYFSYIVDREWRIWYDIGVYQYILFPQALNIKGAF